MSFFQVKIGLSALLTFHVVVIFVGVLYPGTPVIGYGPKIWIRLIPSSGKRLRDQAPLTRHGPTTPGSGPPEVPSVLWSLQTTPNRSTNFTPFFMVYSSEVVLPSEL
jgi:hypothetical protein